MNIKGEKIPIEGLAEKQTLVSLKWLMLKRKMAEG